jgi:hypothetical protein
MLLLSGRANDLLAGAPARRPCLIALDYRIPGQRAVI